MQSKGIFLLAAVLAVYSVASVEGYATCATVRCAAGYVCVMQEVQCIRAPCPPMPQCVPAKKSKSYYGCAAVTCPRGKRCQMKEVQCFTYPCYPVAQCV